LIGVIIPPSERSQFVYFAYRPPLVYGGAALTILSALFCTAYLLRLDRFIPQQWLKYSTTLTRRSGQAAYKLMLSPEIFQPRHLPPDEIPLLPAQVSTITEAESFTEASAEEGDEKAS
jgi:hypothetical protein